eukprot:TRINITY_DN4503_c1_g2_i2.p1 TRINITY_DN4503_c1_g2~~TRINITY_DN4503_c1_g2_i2.p1  ORF type:complete len:395 (-),score=66.80 TRINITY_DN4503_c1_g2_i2:843-2027(-)
MWPANSNTLKGSFLGAYTHLHVYPTTLQRKLCVVTNQEARLKRGQQYYLKNSDKILQQKREYYLKKKQIILHQKAKYYAKNKENIKRNRIHQLSALEEKNIYDNDKRELIKNKSREYYWNNKVAILNQKRQYYSKHCQAVKMQKKIYRLKNKDKIKVISRRYYLKKRQKHNLIIRTYRDWSDPTQVKLFFEHASRHLFITHPADWYRISRDQIKHVGGVNLFKTFGTLGKALQYVYPDMQWDFAKFSLRGKKSTQRWLRILLQQLLPDTDVFEDFLHPDLVWDDQSNQRMELDLWVPKYNLALEYQGEHHYYNLHSAYGPSGTASMYISRDCQKKSSCVEHGITLATVPYWWDGKRESLASSLHHIRPDIFMKTDCPQIPSLPPTNFQDSTIIN